MESTRENVNVESPSKENPALQRSRALGKILKGAKQYVEQGYLPFIAYTVLPGGKLRKIGDSSTFNLLDSDADKMMLNKLTRSMMIGKNLKLVDSKDSSSDLTPRNQKMNAGFFPLLPNKLSSHFWNQYWIKEVLTNVFKFLGYGQGGIPYGTGPLPRGYPEDFVIPYEKFTGPGGKPPLDFKGNYKEALHQLLLLILEEHDIDGEVHVCDPPMGKWVPKSQRSEKMFVEDEPKKRKRKPDDDETNDATKEKNKKKKRAKKQGDTIENQESVGDEDLETAHHAVDDVDLEEVEFCEDAAKETAPTDAEKEVDVDLEEIVDFFGDAGKETAPTVTEEIEKTKEIIVQLGETSYCKDRFNTPINDGTWFTERCAFAPKLSAFVSKNLESGDLVKVIKFSKSQNGASLILEEVCKVGTNPEPIGDPESIDDTIDKKNKAEKKKKTKTIKMTPSVTRSIS